MIKFTRTVKKDARKAERNNEIRAAAEEKVNPKGFFQMYETKSPVVGPLASGLEQLPYTHWRHE